MIIVCPNCSTRLQIDDDKSPPGAFTVRCPKCKNTLNSVSNPAAEQSALGVGGSPATEHPRYEQSTAPTYQVPSGAVQADTNPNDEALRMLVNLLSKGQASSFAGPGERPSWSKRKVLLCTSDQYRDHLAKGLSQNGYQVYIAAEDTRQAVETMRANQLEVVVLEPQFDAAEQGSAFVVREINVLRPAQRRRLFFVLVSPSLRTMDAHAAFLNNVNAVVNLNDLGELPKILEVALREFNELYRELNQAFSLSPL